MFCIKCGQKIPDDSAFCQFCGSTLVPQAAEPVQPAAPVTVKKEKKQKFCKECGSPIDSESNKCTGCGKQYFKIKGKPKAKGCKFKWWYAAVAIAVLLVGYVAVNYIGAVSAMNNKEFVKSLRRFDALGISETVFADKYYYVKLGAKMEEKNYLAAVAIEELAPDTYESELLRKELEKNLYDEGVAAYRAGDLTQAKVYFSYVLDYKQSSDYLNLIRVKELVIVERGVVSRLYNNELKRIIQFEDAAEVILSNKYIAYEFLEGKWTGGDYYFELKELSGGMYSEYNLPHKDINGNFTFENGVYKMLEGEEETKLFKFDLIDADTMNVYCYKDGSTHKLYRQ